MGHGIGREEEYDASRERNQTEEEEENKVKLWKGVPFCVNTLHTYLDYFILLLPTRSYGDARNGKSAGEIWDAVREHTIDNNNM